MQSESPASLMVFASVASDGKVRLPHFIEGELKINTGEYLKILIRVLLSWIRENCDPSKVMFVEDSVPAPELKNLQTYLKENLPMFVP